MNALFFSAQWCIACKRMYPTVKKLQDEGFKIEIIDTDKNKPLAKQYGVDALPTLVILDGEKVVEKFVGIVSEDRIKAVFKKQHDYKIW